MSKAKLHPQVALAMQQYEQAASRCREREQSLTALVASLRKEAEQRREAIVPHGGPRNHNLSMAEHDEMLADRIEAILKW